MKIIIQKLDYFFLASDPEEISISNRITFYGFYLAVAGVAGITGINLYL